MILSVEFTIAALVLVVAAGFVSTAFLWYLWAKSHGSWLLRALARAATVMQIAGTYLGWIAYIRVTQGLSGVPVWTSALTTIAVLMMCSVPPYLAGTFVYHSRSK